jgi:death-on-curing protein
MTDAVEIAAAWLFYLCQNHACVDGNKRTALASCLVFLGANGLLPDPDAPAQDIDDRERLVLDVSASHRDREQTTARLRKLLKKKRG